VRWQLIRLTLPRIQFVYLGPCVCLRLPSDSASRPTPLPSANGRRSPAPIPDFHRRDDAHAGRTAKKPVPKGTSFARVTTLIPPAPYASTSAWPLAAPRRRPRSAHPDNGGFPSRLTAWLQGSAALLGDDFRLRIEHRLSAWTPALWGTTAAAYSFSSANFRSAFSLYLSYSYTLAPRDCQPESALIRAPRFRAFRGSLQPPRAHPSCPG